MPQDFGEGIAGARIEGNKAAAVAVATAQGRCWRCRQGLSEQHAARDAG